MFKTQWLLASELSSEYQFAWNTDKQLQFSLNIPLTLRVGDYDMDGYPDLLVVMIHQRQAVVFLFAKLF